MQARTSCLVIEAIMAAREERIRIMLSKEISIKISPWIEASRIARGSCMRNGLCISNMVMLCWQCSINTRNAGTSHIQGWRVMRTVLMQLRCIMPQLTQSVRSTICTWGIWCSISWCTSTWPVGYLAGLLHLVSQLIKHPQNLSTVFLKSPNSAWTI